MENTVACGAALIAQLYLQEGCLCLAEKEVPMAYELENGRVCHSLRVLGVGACDRNRDCFLRVEQECHSAGEGPCVERDRAFSGAAAHAQSHPARCGACHASCGTYHYACGTCHSTRHIRGGVGVGVIGQRVLHGAAPPADGLRRHHARHAHPAQATATATACAEARDSRAARLQATATATATACAEACGLSRSPPPSPHSLYSPHSPHSPWHLPPKPVAPVVKARGTCGQARGTCDAACDAAVREARASPGGTARGATCGAARAAHVAAPQVLRSPPTPRARSKTRTRTTCTTCTTCTTRAHPKTRTTRSERTARADGSTHPNAAERCNLHHQNRWT